MIARLVLLLWVVAGPALAEPAAPEDVAGSAVAYGDDLRVEGHTRGNAVAYGGDLEVVGTVDGNAVSFGGDLIVRGSVAGNVHAWGGDILLAPGATVGGTVTSVGGEVLRASTAETRGEIAAVGGSTIELSDGAPGAIRNAQMETPRVARSAGQEVLLRFAVIFGLGFLLRLLAPRRIFEMEQEIRKRPVRAGVAGLLVLLALLPLSAFLGIIVVGIPVAMALWFLLFAAVALGAAAGIQALGRAVPVLRRRKSQTLVLAVGAGLLALIGLLPGIDWVLYFAFALVGLGAAVSTRFGSTRSGLPAPIGN